MILQIFDVEHGACALITTSNGKRVMIDAGHNATTGWRPGDALRSAGIEQLDRLFITNYDEDHVSGFPNLMDRVYVNVLTRNWHVSPMLIRYLKSETGMGPGIDRLVASLTDTFTGGAPTQAALDFGDTSFEIFANPYGAPPFGFSDENNLSLVVFVTRGTHRLVFPGDMEKGGWRALLLNSEFLRYLRGVTIFVASHHGRENGYCEEVFDHCPSLDAVIISDQSIEYESQETLSKYRKHVHGFQYDGKQRRILTTRNDGHITIDFPAYGRGSVRLERGSL